MKCFLATLFSVLWLSCSESGKKVDVSIPYVQPNQSALEARQLIMGTWEWAKSMNQSTPNIVVNTPASTGCNLELIFFANDSVKFYLNDSLISASTFLIDSGYYSSSLTLIMGAISGPDFKVSSEAFSYDNRPADGDFVYYIRK